MAFSASLRLCVNEDRATRDLTLQKCTAGVISTVAGSGDAPGGCQSTAAAGDGPNALAARLFGPADVVVHPNGNLIVADQQNNRIRQVTPAGAVSTIAGNGLHFPYAPG